jgi:prepilin-type N-terminal cleavage/methylation domain-containing protein/prepilin-type processing-associated H-X9-DG protein
VPADRNERRRSGFSFVELLVVIAVLVILVSILLPYVAKLREGDRRVRCADNLRAVREALREYARSNNNLYPRVVFDPAVRGYAAYTGAAALSPFVAGGAVKPNDVTASLWLLVRQGLVTPSQFVCPSTGDQADPNFDPARPAARSNFTGGMHLSYGYSSPFSAAPGYRMNDTQPADFAVMSDKSPGVAPAPRDDVTGPRYTAPPTELAPANSNNHRKSGQNVLYADGHVQFQRTAYCGVGHADRRDNIYTALSPVPLAAGNNPPAEGKGYYGPTVGPSWSADSYLVPTDDE